VTLRARQVPEVMALIVKGNPEYLEPSALEALADNILDEAVRRLTTGCGDAGKLIEQ
jgi:hypothetical protein